MAHLAMLNASMSSLSLSRSCRRPGFGVSNGTLSHTCMRTRDTYHVEASAAMCPANSARGAHTALCFLGIHSQEFRHPCGYMCPLPPDFLQVSMDENEPVDSGMRRFRRAVMASNLLMEVGGQNFGLGHAARSAAPAPRGNL